MEKVQECLEHLRKKDMSLRIKGVLHKSQVQSILSGGAKCWVMKEKIKEN